MILFHDLSIGISTLIRHESLDRGTLEKGAMHLPERIRAANPKRIREWIGARLALQEAFRHFGVSADPMITPMEGHHALRGLPEWRFTLSHDGSASVAWLAKASETVGMGIDIEEATRSVTPAVRNRIISPKDVTLESVELWSLKEAIFKSLPEAEQSGLPFRYIGVLPQGGFSVENSSCRGSWLQKRSGSSIVSYAWRAS